MLPTLQQSLQLDASERPTCSQLLRSELFTKDNFAQKFPQELRSRIQKENQQNPLLLKSMNRGAAAERNNRDSHGDNVKENKETSRKKKKDKVRECVGKSVCVMHAGEVCIICMFLCFCCFKDKGG